MRSKLGPSLFAVAVVIGARLLAPQSAAANTLKLSADFVTSGNGVRAELTLDHAPAAATTFYISLSGTNAATADKGFQLPAGQTIGRFAVKSAPTATEQFVDVAVTSEDRATTFANARFKVIPASLSELSLSRSSVVGGTPTGAVNVIAHLDGIAPASGLTAVLGATCPACDTEREANPLGLPLSIQIEGGKDRGLLTVQPRRVRSSRQITVLASLAGVTKSALLVDDSLRPQSIAVSPASISGTQATTLTVTLNAPSYDKYALELSCSQPLSVTGAPCPPDFDLMRHVETVVGQQTYSFQAHSQPLTSPTQITIKARGVSSVLGPIGGTVQATLTVAP